MRYLNISIGIFIALAVSRFVPHPPNFTSLLALSFYVPAVFGIRFIPVLIISFAITDYFIGFHNLSLFTWGSVLIIGLISKYFLQNILKRIVGALFGCVIFFIITNFGVRTSGFYGYTIMGLIECYVLAIPFFSYSLISTFIFSSAIETIWKYKLISKLIKKFV